MPSSTGHSCIGQQSKLRLVLVIIVLTLFMKHFKNQSYNGPYMHVKYTGGKSNVCFHKWTFICLTRPSKIPSATLKKWSWEQDQSRLNYCNWINQSAFCFVFFFSITKHQSTAAACSLNLLHLWRLPLTGAASQSSRNLPHFTLTGVPESLFV